MKLSTARKLTILAFIVLVIIALAFHTGTGNLSSLGIDAIAYICPLGSIEAMLASLTLIPRPIIALVVLIILGFLLGKVFCAWICPIPPIKHFFDKKAWRSLFKAKESLENAGTLKIGDISVEGTDDVTPTFIDTSELPASKATELATSDTADVSSEAITLDIPKCDTTACNSKRCSSCADKRKKLDSRHIVLGGALLSTAIFGFPVFCIVCPVGLVFASIVAWWRFVGFAELTITLIVFPAILLLEILVLRKWCLKFCPLGAVMSLLSLPNRFLRPKVDMTKCKRSQGLDCTVCVDICEENLDPHDTSGMHECSKCGMCMEHCPTRAITMPFCAPKTSILQAGKTSDASDTE